MNPTTFLIALAALSIGTYAMRLAGVKVGAALALRGRRRTLVRTDGQTDEAIDDPAGRALGDPTGRALGDPTGRGLGDPTGGASVANETTTSAGEPHTPGATTSAAPTTSAVPTTPTVPTTSADDTDEPTSRVTAWMDKATVVLIGAVFATTAIFDGQDIADPARLIGVGVGVLAAVLRVPILVCVIVAMAVCAGIRMTGIL